MTTPTIGAHVTFTALLPHGTRRKLGSATGGIVTAVTWNGRISVQIAGSTGVIWCDVIDVETEATA
jgi:hypothetical protein